jgi:hypothetical protein
MAWLGKAGNAGRGMAGPVKARPAKAAQGRHGEARQGQAWRGMVRIGTTTQAWQREARPGAAGRVEANRHPLSGFGREGVTFPNPWRVRRITNETHNPT